MRRFRRSERNYDGRKPTLFGRIFTRRRAERPATTVATGLTFEVLEPRLQMAVVINEFLAANTNGLMDQDGDRPDWIELYNDGAAPVELAGWHLTDDELDLDQWTLPTTNLAAGGYLVIFASGKDRAVSAQELHTNFALEQDGEFLALVLPDGTTIADSFAPFPEQLENVSYGQGLGGVTSEPLVDENETVRVHVPTDGTLGTTWTATVFDDSTWLEGDTAIGYERTPGGTIDFTSYFQMDVNALMPSSPTPRDTIYTRIPFNVSDVGALQSMNLLMRYDDGIVAYLNGQEIARKNAPSTPAWNSAASASHGDSLAILYETIPVTAHLDKLVEGANVLAIHGLNATGSTNRTDFLIGPMLVVDRATQPVISYMSTPTPGAANVQGTLGFVADTKFSIDRGFYTGPFNVAITTATDGAEIRYTLDGSLPTATTGLIYNPISPPLITTTTNLRAAAFKTGYTPSNVDTQTYIFLDDVIEQDGSGLPAYANWGWAGPDWAMDPDVVTDPLYAGTIKDDLKAVPTVSLVMPWNDWFGDGGQGIYISGKNIERQGSMEFFTADGSEEFQIDAALEIQGGTSTDRWKMDKLSMRVTFKEPYGPTKLDADIFHNSFSDESATVNFDTLILDAQLNYTWPYGGTSNAVDQRSRAKFIQDQYVSDLQNLAGGQAPHGRIVHLYLNGLYWGIYMLHERPDESFAESYLGGDKDDYDVLKHNPTDVVNGDATAIANYDALLQLVRQDMTVSANYAAVEQMVDIDDLIGYMIVNYYVGNDDWAHQNWYATYDRVDPNGKWRFHSWDAERVLTNVSYNAIQTGGYVGSPEEIHLLLSANSEYRLKFVDHVQRLLYNGGLLTPEGAAAVYMARMQEADRAIVGESARWGDSHTTSSEPPGAGGAYTRDHWLATQNDLLTNYFPLRSHNVLVQFASRGWVVPLAAPLMSQYGGTVTPSSEVTLSQRDGTPGGAVIYYTLDGSDPRDRNTNLPSSSAIVYGGPITFLDGLGKHIQARVYLDDPLSSMVNEWSPVVDATFLQEAPFPVRITEINYHPAEYPGVADDEDLEFIELYNSGSQMVSLAGVQITEFASNPVVFSSGINLAAGARIIVARNPAVFQSVYGPGYNVLPTGYGTANLSNGGERIVLLGPLGETLQDFTYNDVAPWPTSPDGEGPTLEIINALGDASDPANWRASLYVNGSPGASGVPGDYDGNSVVEPADYGVWGSKFGLPVAVGTSADGNRDGMVDAADYLVWRKGMTPPGSGAAVSTSVATAVAAPEEKGDGSLFPSNALPVESQPESEKDSRPLFLAVDDFFTRFESARPAFRPAFARTSAADAGDDELLLASLASRADRAMAGDAHVIEEGRRGDDEPVDRLLADWAGVDDVLDAAVRGLTPTAKRFCRCAATMALPLIQGQKRDLYLQWCTPPVRFAGPTFPPVCTHRFGGSHMSSTWLLEFGSYMFVASLGIAGGWWLRGKIPQRTVRRPTTTDRKQIAEQALASLHAAAETVRSCVQQHIDCIQTIKRELQESSATEPAIINNAAASIIAANGLVKHQFDDIQRAIDAKKEEISDCLDSSGGLLLTFASLDRQKHIYRQVLTSLEQLAADLTGDITGHGRRLDKISAGLQDDPQRDVAKINGAVAQIVDAAGDLQRKVESAEHQIEHQAETVEMQAVLSHTDLLTSLPNRRAFEAELERGAGQGKGRSMCTVIFIDVDRFAQVNSEYGHQGGDVILRQAAAMIKPLVRGKDLVARYAGDTFAIVLRDTTVHDALPVAERIRKLIETGHFSHGHHPLRITASLGVAQLRPDEMPSMVIEHAGMALRTAQQAGGNLCFRHDGQQCHPVSTVFQAKEEQARDSSLTLASMWRETMENDDTYGIGRPAAAKADDGPVLSGRSLFAANLNRRLSEWKRGGPTVSVLVLRVDQMDELVARFGAKGQNFLRQVLGRLLEAATREMDERCEFEDGLFALLLPGTDEANALAVADRLRSQVRQCKVRMGSDLWDLTASIGLAHSTVASRVMDIMLSAEAAMKEVAQTGGDAVRLGETLSEEQIAAAK